MTDSGDVRVELTLKNNRILERMEEAGIESNAQLHRLMNGVSQTEIGRLINMKQRARLKDGSWCDGAVKLADFFHCEPDDLFSIEQQWDEIEYNRVMAKLTFAETRRFLETYPQCPEQAFVEAEFKTVTTEVLSSLSPREERVLRMRFGFHLEEGEMDLDSVGFAFRVTRERVRQIEAKALRKLRHPSRSRKLRTFLDYQ